MQTDSSFTAFVGNRCIKSGGLEEVVLETKKHADLGENVLVFEDRTGNPIDFDLRGTEQDALDRLPEHPHFVARSRATEDEPKRAGPGRPKLGVVSREVSLLPRHWEWLESQRGGISVALRSLVEEARKRNQSQLLARKAREAAGKFMWTMAGNFEHFEEASRAVYARDDARLLSLIREWPKDIRRHVQKLVGEAVKLEEQAAAEAASSPK